MTLADVRRHLAALKDGAHLEANGLRVSCRPVPHGFGGSLWWLICPLCGHRRAALYVRKLRMTVQREAEPRSEHGNTVRGECETRQQLGCRVCFGLGYPSQRLSVYWLARHRARILWRRLGGTDEAFDDLRVWRWPKRPKSMRRATQARLQDEYDRQVERSETEIAVGMYTLFQRLGVLDAAVTASDRGP